jgi:hypothetical protein
MIFAVSFDWLLRWICWSFRDLNFLLDRCVDVESERSTEFRSMIIDMELRELRRRILCGGIVLGCVGDHPRLMIG